MVDFSLAVLAGLICGVLSGFGIGGGSLLMVWLTVLLSMDQRTAQGINLLFYLCAVLGAFPVHIKKQTLSWRLLFELCILGVPASLLGALLGAHIPQRAARIAMGCFLLAGGVLALLSPLLQKRRGTPPQS